MANKDHLDLTAAEKAKLTRDSQYRDNGYDHISGGGRKRRYARIGTIQEALQRRNTQPRGGDCEPGSPQHAQRYTFTYKKNFKLGITPYPNQGHHLLPEQAFGEKVLGRKERYLVGKVDYNINDGDNIVFLPVFDADTEFHRLPYHGGSHPDYTKLVVADMKEVRESLQRAIAKDKDHKNWNPPGDIKSKLEKLEKDYWKFLTKDFPAPLSVNRFRKPAQQQRAQQRTLSKSKR